VTRPLSPVAGLAIIALALTVAAAAQRADQTLAKYIDGIRAVDNHSHVVAPDAEHDRGFDALPCDSLPSGGALAPANTRIGGEVLLAWKQLYGVSLRDFGDSGIAAARQAQSRTRATQGDKYFPYILDSAGIDVALANRTRMDRSLAAGRFRWVPYDDALLFPLDNAAGKQRTPDRAVFFEHEERLLLEYLRADGLTTLPASLEAYVQFVRNTLAAQKRAGAVAIKFEVAYLRSLDFTDASAESAAAVYGRHRGGGPPAPADYKTLQDFLFTTIAAEAGQLGLAVHVHTGLGCGDFFDLLGARPILLTEAFDNPRLRQTTFVMLHGGSPDERSITALIQKPRVFVDTSLLEYLWSPQELARTLRTWLEIMPEHVLFGTDAGPNAPGLGWEETTWIGSRRLRAALTIALTQMENDGVVSAARAREIAERVLRTNAVDLYALGRP
jgi:predicted TIM-barrel fold metal-dependent hydrolase